MRKLSHVSLLVLTYGSSALGAEEYPIQLDRLPKAGSVIEVTSRTEQTGDLGPALAPVKRAGVTGNFRTVATLVVRVAILEVDAEGLTTQAKLQVVQCDTVPR